VQSRGFNGPIQYPLFTNPSNGADKVILASSNPRGKSAAQRSADGVDVRDIPLTCIRLDGGTQVRVAMCQETLARYEEDMKAGHNFPPPVVYADPDEPDSFWLSDGFHRLAAWSQLGHDSMLCEVRPGGLKAAFLHALEANIRHGLPLTRKDKLVAVVSALQKREAGLIDASDREIARLLGVSNFLVSTVRRKREWVLGTNTDPAGRKKGPRCSVLTDAERREANDDAQRLTWDGLTALRPALADLLAEADACEANPPADHCFERVWWGPDDDETSGNPTIYGTGLLARIESLVGWHAPGPPVLRTSAAFDLACDVIGYALPPCHAGCDCGLPTVADPWART
jgi:hypothetical protein